MEGEEGRRRDIRCTKIRIGIDKEREREREGGRERGREREREGERGREREKKKKKKGQGHMNVEPNGPSGPIGSPLYGIFFNSISLFPECVSVYVTDVRKWDS